MNQNHRKPEPPDLRHFAAKRRPFPLDELAKYAGQYVAWSPDGAQIVASGPTEEAVEAKLQAAGIAPSQVVGEFIPAADSVLF
jgi:uncharacterized protein DUF5678